MSSFFTILFDIGVNKRGRANFYLELTGDSIMNGQMELLGRPAFTVCIATQPTPDKMAQAARCAQFWEKGLSDLGSAPIVTVLPGEPSIAEAYNRALSATDTPFVLLAHSDAFPLTDVGQPIGRRLLDRLVKGSLDLAGFCGSSRLVGPRWQDCGSRLFGRVINIPPQPQPGQVFSMICWRAPAKTILGIRALDGYCLVGKTDTIRKFGFCEEYPGFHFYDVDIAARMADAGCRVGVLTDVVVAHQSSVGYADPAWSAGVPLFMRKWRGKADVTVAGIQQAPGTLSAQDLGLLLSVSDQQTRTLPDLWDASEED
jgi:hypothetical protein